MSDETRSKLAKTERADRRIEFPSLKQPEAFASMQASPHVSEKQCVMDIQACTSFSAIAENGRFRCSHTSA